MILWNMARSLSVAALLVTFLGVTSDIQAQRRPLRIGGRNGVVMGGGMGFKVGGANGVQFGGGQGASFGPERFGMQFGGGQGTRFGSSNMGMQFGNGQGARFVTPNHGVQFGAGQGAQFGHPQNAQAYRQPIQHYPLATPMPMNPGYPQPKPQQFVQPLAQRLHQHSAQQLHQPTNIQGVPASSVLTPQTGNPVASAHPTTLSRPKNIHVQPVVSGSTIIRDPGAISEAAAKSSPASVVSPETPTTVPEETVGNETIDDQTDSKRMKSVFNKKPALREKDGEKIQ